MFLSCEKQLNNRLCPSVRRFVGPPVSPSGVSQKARIQQNSREFNKIQQNSRLFATAGRVTALFSSILHNSNSSSIDNHSSLRPFLDLNNFPNPNVVRD